MHSYFLITCMTNMILAHYLPRMVISAITSEKLSGPNEGTVSSCSELYVFFCKNFTWDFTNRRFCRNGHRIKRLTKRKPAVRVRWLYTCGRKVILFHTRYRHVEIAKRIIRVRCCNFDHKSQLSRCGQVYSEFHEEL